MGEAGWALIAGLTVVCFLARAIFVLPSSWLRLSPAVHGVLRYAPAAALMAIIAPDMAILQGEIALTPANPRLLGGLAGFAVAIGTRSTLAAIAVGMAVFTAVRLAG